MSEQEEGSEPTAEPSINSSEPSVSAEDDWAAALAEQAQAEENEKKNQKKHEGLEADSDFQKQTSKRAEFEEFNRPSESDEPRRITELDVILDIPVTISMEVGKTLITIRNLLKLNQGSVIELDRLAGEPLDVLVNGTLIAHGEVVVVNEKFGIRLTDVMSAAERIKKIE